MNKKIRRILCLLLMLALVVSVAPPRRAAAITPNGREQEVIRLAEETYRASQAGSGRYSFFGYCGTMVSWELYLLGITTNKAHMDGRDAYNYFRYQTVTNGGYPVKPYTGGWWSLYGALYDLTQGGTKDVYNVLVGFESTPSQAGSRYGHALVIFGIIDGVVYFNESAPIYANGSYYPEGATIACTIKEFSDLYSYATFDGLIHFGRKSYAESCTQYPAYLYGAATEAAVLYTEPCLPETDERSTPVRKVQAGEYLSVIGLYVNPLGEYWYQVEEDSHIYYISAERIRVAKMRFDDVVIRNANFPGELRQGRNYGISGDIYAGYNRVTTVRAQLFAMDGTQQTHVRSATQSVDSRRFSLANSGLVSELSLPELQTGSYRVELAVVVGNYYYADGQLQTQWKTVKIWRSDFMVVSRSYSTYHVEFDAAGGSSQLEEISLYIGDRIPQMPQATRPGYVFAGWYTEDGVPVTERTVIAESMTLYAHWSRDEDATGWYPVKDGWVYLMNGEETVGFVGAGENACFITTEGAIAKGWMRIRDRIFYFLPSGAMYLGWMETEDGAMYFTANGAAVGDMLIDDVQYHFDEQGILQNTKQ